MDKATTASVLGTILGLAAGIMGMLMFAPPADNPEMEERLAAIARERDDAMAERDAAKQALGVEADKRQEWEDTSRELAAELDAKATTKGDFEADARDWKEKHDRLKADSDERERLKQARIDSLEDLLENNGILEHLSDEEIAERVAALEATFGTAFSGKDKKAAMQALWDLQKLGPKAYDKSIEVWRQMAADFGLDPWGQGPGELGMTFQEYVSLVSSFGLIEYGLTDPDVESDFRIASIYGLPWWSNEDPSKRAELAGGILGKAQGYEAQAAVEALRDIPDPSTARYLADYITSNTDNPAARKSAVMVLAQKNTPAGWAAIEDAAANDPDLGVQEAAKSALNQKDVPVAGVLITQVIENYQAALAGIKVGDILTHYNGVRVKNLNDVNNAKQNVAEGTAVQVVLRRGESDVTLTLGSGMIGINGVAVTPKDD
ncbi:MAG: PDZ domain-containing protein [Planctomycetes bacterium]|nr:PDZ domain-containing protein [Planctomycetota bacterium]